MLKMTVIRMTRRGAPHISIVYCRQVTARPTDRLLKTIERSCGPGGIM